MAEQRIPRVEEHSAPAKSKPILEELKKKFGHVPNIFASVAHSSAALHSMMAMMGHLEDGSLTGLEQEAIALRVGEMHGCRYCSAAHTAKAKMLGATVEQTVAWRKGKADEPRTQVIIDLAVEMVENRGHIVDQTLTEALELGLTEADLIEVVACVTINTFTNYINALVQTEVDFPAVDPI